MKQDSNSKSLPFGLTTTSSRSNSKTKKSNMYQSSWAVLTGKILFLSCLVAVAVTLGILANHFLSGSEEELAKTQYNSIVDRALETSKEIVVRKSLGAISMASVMEVAFPNASSWPYVALNGYELIADHIVATSNGRELSVMPIVQPEQIESFEKFAKDYYTKDRVPPFPNQTGNLAGVSSFGFGIFGIDTTLPNTTDQRYRVTDGSTSYGSMYNIVLPIIQHSSSAQPFLLLNSHFEKSRGEILDGVLDCAKKRQMASLNDENKISYRSINCGGITDVIQLASSKIIPGALIMRPIYPYHDDTIITGMIASSIVWEESLHNCFSSEVSGLDCVVRSHDAVYTYRIEKGVATLKGEGDLHNSEYDEFSRSICLTCGEVFNDEFSVKYTLVIFPTEEFFEVYSTSNPMIASIGAIMIIIFTSCLFILYDYFVRREFQSKKDLLKAKRQFMRFVSHEVRTPLNSVSMGLVLLKEEMEMAHRRQVQIEESMNKENESPAGIECHPGNKMKVSIQDVSTSNQVLVQKSALNIHKNVNVDTFVDWLQLTSEIYHNSQAAVDVLSDLLNYDKIETGTLHLELTLISLWTLLEQTANEFKVSAAQSKIQYDTVVTPIITCSDIERQSISTKNSITASGTTADTRIIESDSAGLDVETPITTKLAVFDASKYKAIGDSVRLSQCIRNLISNAVKFTPENGKLTIRATWTKLDSNLGNKSKRNGTAQVDTFVLAKGESVSYSCVGIFEMTVTDSGAGMTEEQLSHLFGDGVQFNVNELQGGNGTGLGLHITKGIVEQHNGSITASSDGLGLGTTFAITLPIYDVPETAANERIRKNLILISSIKVKNPVDTSDCTVEASHLRILIVDDATTNRKLLRRLLQNHGHICDEAPDGEVALRIVQDSMETSNVFYDTILMDHEMPVMDGPTSVKKMRDIGCQSLIVGITGNILPEDIAKFKRSGADNVLPKPFHLNDLSNIWVENGLVRREETVS